MRNEPKERPWQTTTDRPSASMGAGLASATEAARLGHRALAVVGDGEQDRPRHGVELTNPDLVKLAESFG